MLINRIEGFTRELGKSQGYLGLPVRDEVMIDNTNNKEVDTMTTAWQPSLDEIQALINGASINVRLFGTQHPPIMLTVGPVPE